MAKLLKVSGCNKKDFALEEVLAGATLIMFVYHYTISAVDSYTDALITFCTKQLNKVDTFYHILNGLKS